MAKYRHHNGLAKRHRIIAEKNPTWLIKHHLGIEPWPNQKRILKAITKNKRVAASSREKSGKTFTAAMATIWWLLIHEEAIVVNTAPTNRLITKHLWPEIAKIYNRNPQIIGGLITRNKLEISHRHYAIGFATNQPERFQGFHNRNILIIVDEASDVPEFIYDAISGCMTTANARLLMIGKPNPQPGTFNNAVNNLPNSYNKAIAKL